MAPVLTPQDLGGPHISLIESRLSHDSSIQMDKQNELELVDMNSDVERQMNNPKSKSSRNHPEANSYSTTNARPSHQNHTLLNVIGDSANHIHDMDQKRIIKNPNALNSSRSKSKLSRNSSHGRVIISQPTSSSKKGNNKLNLVIELAKATQENIGFTVRKSPRKRAKSPKKRSKSKS